MKPVQLESRRASRVYRAGRMAVCLGLFLLVIAGCGRKGPPVPPLRQPIPTPVELDGHLEGDVAVLSWRHSAATPDVREYAVMRAQSRAGEPPCPGCPLLFQEAGRIMANTGSAIFDFNEPVPAGFIYTYKIQTVGPSGVRGQDSNRIIIDRSMR